MFNDGAFDQGRVAAHEGNGAMSCFSLGPLSIIQFAPGRAATVQDTIQPGFVDPVLKPGFADTLFFEIMEGVVDVVI